MLAASTLQSATGDPTALAPPSAKAATTLPSPTSLKPPTGAAKPYSPVLTQPTPVAGPAATGVTSLPGLGPVSPMGPVGQAVPTGAPVATGGATPTPLASTLPSPASLTPPTTGDPVVKPLTLPGPSAPTGQPSTQPTNGSPATPAPMVQPPPPSAQPSSGPGGALTAPKASDPSMQPFNDAAAAAGIDVSHGFSWDQLTPQLQQQFASLDPLGAQMAQGTYKAPAAQSPSPYESGVQDLGGGMAAPVLTPQANEATTLGINLNAPDWYQQYQAIKGGAPNPNTVITLQNGVLSKNGAPVGVENNTGAFVDPATGALTSAGGVVAAQSSGANPGISPSSLAALGKLPTSASNPFGAGSAVSVANQDSAAPSGVTPAAIAQLLNNGSVAANSGFAGSPNTSTTASGTPTPTPPLSPATPVSTTGVSGAPGITIAPTGAASAIQTQLDALAGNLGSVDRTALGENMFSQFATESDPAYQAAIRAATQAAAGAGRVGSGMLRTDYGNLALNRTQQLQNAQQDFMNTALQGSIQDKLNNISTLQSLQGQNFGQQNTLDQQAIADALQQYQTELAAQQQQFNQGVTLTEVGMQGNPANYYAQAAALLGSTASQADIARLAQQMASANPAAPTTSPAPAYQPPAGSSPTLYSGGPSTTTPTYG